MDKTLGMMRVDREKYYYIHFAWVLSKYKKLIVKMLILLDMY